MVDYRRFLGASSQLVAPWLGGATISTADRALRVATRPAAPGWYRFEVTGREARLLGVAEPAELSALPRVRGHVWAGRLISEGARVAPLCLLPEDELPVLAPVSARRWHDGSLLFEQLEFESDAEGPAREALAKGTGLEVKGAPATLRAAWALALADRVSRQLTLPGAAAELRPHLGAIAERGAQGAEAALRALQREREQAQRELDALRARLEREDLEAALVQARQARLQELEARRLALGAAPGGPDGDALLSLAMAQAGAQLEHVRRLADHRLEVVFAFMGERFIAVADASTWQVYDSGICLGHPPRDELITLESLPSVIREAIDTDQLVILRYP